jgi:hypothetical protein
MRVATWEGGRKGKCHVEDLGLDGRIILKWILEVGFEDGDITEISPDRIQWRAAVKAVMNPRVLQKTRHFLNSLSTISFSRTLLRGV